MDRQEVGLANNQARSLGFRTVCWWTKMVSVGAIFFSFKYLDNEMICRQISNNPKGKDQAGKGGEQPTGYFKASKGMKGLEDTLVTDMGRL